MTRHYYDNTMISAYKNCPRAYFLRHVMYWRREGTAPALTFGLSWHAGQDGLWAAANSFNENGQYPQEGAVYQAAIDGFMKTWKAEGLPEVPTLEQAEVMGARTPSTAKEMYHNYILTRWQMLCRAKLIAPEQPFAVPLPGCEKTWYVGRLDKVIDYNGETVVLEHKTTTEYKVDGGFKSSYLDSWYTDSQVKGYEFGASLYYPNMSGVWVDAALVHKKVHDKFRLIPVKHSFSLMQEWLSDTKEWVTRINHDLDRYQQGYGKLSPGTFPRNEGQCIGKYAPCGFLDICRGTCNPEELPEPPHGYIVDQWQPFDILELNKILTKNKEK